MRKTTKRTLIVAGVAAAATGAASIAFAAWTADAEGTASATAGNSAGINNLSGTVVGVLHPGAVRPLEIKLTNNDPYKISIREVVLRGDQPFKVVGSEVSGTDAELCEKAHGLIFATLKNVNGLTDKTGHMIEIPANTNDGPGTPTTVQIPNAVRMTNSAVDQCQNQKFQIAVTVRTASSESSS